MYRLLVVFVFLFLLACLLRARARKKRKTKTTNNRYIKGLTDDSGQQQVTKEQQRLSSK